jgi:hypothetical protein
VGGCGKHSMLGKSLNHCTMASFVAQRFDLRFKPTFRI